MFVDVTGDPVLELGERPGLDGSLRWWLRWWLRHRQHLPERLLEPADANRPHIVRTVPNRRAYPRHVPDESRPSILPTIVVGSLVLVVGLTVLGWLISAVLTVVRTVVIVAIVVAVLWALVAARADR